MFENFTAVQSSAVQPDHFAAKMSAKPAYRSIPTIMHNVVADFVA